MTINSTDGTNLWESESLALAIDTSANLPVVFTSESNSTYSTSGWTRYGNTLAWGSSSGALETQFYATNDSQADGVWALYWRDATTNVGDGVSVALRSSKPSTLHSSSARDDLQ